MGGRGAVGAALVAAVAASVAVTSVAVAAPASARDRYAVGDSVMLGAKPELRDRGFRVDAIESRQAYSGPALLRSKGAGLPTNVVVHLGTNGTFPLDTCKRLVRVAGAERRVFLVTVHAPRSWQKGNNNTIRACDSAFAPERVTVIDWNQAANGHRGWFYSDRIHLKPAGRAAFAQLIDSAVDTAVRSARESKAQARQQALLNAAGRGVAGLTG